MMSTGLCCVWLTLLSGMIWSTNGVYDSNMAAAVLPTCTSSSPPIIPNYGGYMLSDGKALMKQIDIIGPSYFYLYEVSAFSHIPLRYRYEASQMQGMFHNIKSRGVIEGQIIIDSLETGGGDTNVTVYVYMDYPSDTEYHYDFIPSCVYGPTCDYQGPYPMSVFYDDVVAITCTYRLMTMGHPVQCYKGIADCKEINSCLQPLPNFSLSAMSLASQAASYSTYVYADHGKLSVIGVGIWTDSSGSEPGTFEGTMYYYIDPQLGDHVTIVEGYAGLNTSYGNDPEGNFSLRTWETVFVATDEETMMRTSTLPNITLLSKWSCDSNSPEDHYDVSDCNYIVGGKIWLVYWLGLWSQYGDINEQNSSAFCYSASPNTWKNYLSMVPNGYDTVVDAEVQYVNGKSKIEFSLYGEGCGNGPCYGPAILRGCERVVIHGVNTSWGDIGVGDVKKTVWLSDKMGYLGATPYTGNTSVSSVIIKWESLTNAKLGSIEFSRYFNTHSRSLMALDWVDGYYPDNVEENVVFECLANSVVDTKSTQSETAIMDTTISSKIADQPYTIACYLVIGNDCVLSAKPYCAVGTSKQQRQENVEVGIPADIFVSIGGLDQLGVAKYRGQLQGFYPNFTIIGTPVDVMGMIVPCTSTGSTESVATVPSTASCKNVGSLFISIVSVAIPTLSNQILNAYHAVGSDASGIYIEDTQAYLQFGYIRTWSKLRGVKVPILISALDTLEKFGAYCTCTWSSCMPGQTDPNPITSDFQEIALHNAAVTAYNTAVSEKFLVGIYKYAPTTLIKCYPPCTT